MKDMTWNSVAMLLFLAAFAGCSNSSSPQAPAKPATMAGNEAGHDHGGWWCTEHGVPEEVCALCDVELVADFKSKGDWCEEHDRPESQCFLCNPEKEKEFAAQYQAKFGTAPPAHGDEGEGHDHDHDHEHGEHEHADEA